MKIKIDKYILALFFYAIFVCSFTSCEDDNVGEFKLTGNIENLIPNNSYKISRTISNSSNGSQYLIVTPELDDNFEYWGLRLKSVAYYIDDELIMTINSSPYDLVYDISNLSIGKHELLAKMTIQGDECNDVLLEKSDRFTVSTNGEQSSLYGDFYVDYNYVSTGETLHITPYLLEDRSSKGCKINSVTYSWDGKEIGKKTSSPFSFDYQVDDEEGSKHELKVTINYSFNNSENLVYTMSDTNYAVLQNDNAIYKWELKSTRENYQKGETVRSRARLGKGKNCTNSYSLKLYFDDELIGEYKSFPCDIDYKLQNATYGMHTFRIEWKTDKGGGSYSTSSYEKKIVVTP